MAGLGTFEMIVTWALNFGLNDGRGGWMIGELVVGD